MVLYVYSGTGMNMWAQVAPKARRGIRSFGAGVTGGWEPPGMAPGNQTAVLCHRYVFSPLFDF